MQVKRFVRDIQLKDVKLLFAEAVEVLESLRLKPGMHHISWKTLSTELKVKVDSALCRLVVLAQDAAGVSVGPILPACAAFLMLFMWRPGCPSSSEGLQISFPTHAALNRSVSQLTSIDDSSLNSLCVVGDCTGLAVQFAMTYFMPFALTMNSILARLTLLFKGLLARVIEVHGGIALLYLNETTKSNPLRAKTTAVQLRGYSISPRAIEMANV